MRPIQYSNRNLSADIEYMQNSNTFLPHDIKKMQHCNTILPHDNYKMQCCNSKMPLFETNFQTYGTGLQQKTLYLQGRLILATGFCHVIQCKNHTAMRQIKHFRLKRLNKGAHFSFMHAVLQRARTDEAIAGNAALAPQMAKFETSFAREDKYFVISRKNSYTDKLNTLDTNRGRAYMAFKGLVAAYAKVPDDVMRPAALVLQRLIGNYRINVRMQRESETADMTNFIDDAERKYAAQIQTLHLEPVLQVMKTANNDYMATRINRTEEQMTRQPGALNAARAETDAAYRSLAAMVDALAVVEGEQRYAGFIDYVNTLIREYKDNFLRPRRNGSQDE